MKRTPPRLRGGIREYDVLDAFTKDQLAWIGACAMAYNDAEVLLHVMVGNCLNFPGNNRDVTSRINGTDGLIAIVKATVAAWGDLGDEVENLIDHALSGEGFPLLKSYRDAAIHAQITDSESGVAHRPYARRGEVMEVLLTEAALKRLYEGLSILTLELEELCQILSDAGDLRTDPPEPDGPRRVRIEESIQAAIAQCRDHQRRRLSLEPFSKFPQESPSD